MKCEGIYCRIEARERLKAQGFSEEEAREISNKVFGIVKDVIKDERK